MRTVSAMFKQPITKLCVLSVEQEQEIFENFPKAGGMFDQTRLSTMISANKSRYDCSCASLLPLANFCLFRFLAFFLIDMEYDKRSA